MLGIRRSLLQGLDVELQTARLLRLSNYAPEIGGTNLDSSDGPARSRKDTWGRAVLEDACGLARNRFYRRRSI
jgi:hypothetical protein